MTTDLSHAIALACAWLDGDEDGLYNMTEQADPAQLVTQLLMLCLQLGRLAYGDDETLRNQLSDALTRDAPAPRGGGVTT